MKTNDEIDELNDTDLSFDFDADFKPSWMFYVALAIGLIVWPFMWMHDKYADWKEKRKFVKSLRR